MDDPLDDRHSSSRHRLLFSKENFDDYLLTLMIKLRLDPDADRLLTGETVHPLIQYQIENHNALMALTVPFYSNEQLIENPVVTYINFLRQIITAILRVWSPLRCYRSQRSTTSSGHTQAR